MLRALLDRLEEVRLTEEFTLLFLGDYVDRGENSRAVLETMLTLRERYPDTIFLRGNHEQLMLDAYDQRLEPDPTLYAQLTLTWLQNGGIDTLLSYAPPGFQEWCDSVDHVLLRIPAGPLLVFKEAFRTWIEAIPEAHWQFLRATRMDYVTPRYHFVHAGLLEPGRTSEDEGWSIDPRLWIREPFLSSRADFDGHIVVFGHTPQRSGRPLIHRNKIGLDTGAVFGGPLTAGLFDTRKKGKEQKKGQRKEPRFFQTPYMREAPPFSWGGASQTADARRCASSARSSRK